MVVTNSQDITHVSESQDDELLSWYYDLQDYAHSLERDLEELTVDFQGIFDVSNFKFRLQLDGLLTPELGEFIDIYVKHYNDRVS